MEWTVDLSEVNGLKGWYKKQPNKMRIAQAKMLTRFAWGTRDQAVVTLGQLMTVRNPRFVSGRLRVTPATQARQISWAGSVATKRFSGWTEQEKGTATDRKRYGTLAGRSGDKNKQLRQAVRLKQSNEVVQIMHYDYNPKGGTRNIGGFLAMAKRRGETRLLKIGKMLLKRKGSKFEEVQVLRKKQPKRIHWLQIARATYFRRINIDALWVSIVEPLMGKPNKR